jgi:PhnB protein
MKLNTYLVFDGRCKEAFEFYAQVLGGKIESMISHRGTPAEGQVPPEWLDKIMHAHLTLDDSLLMGSDAPPQYQKKPQSFSVNIGLDSDAEAERIFHALAENGQVIMPIGPTFWATRFGMAVDQFGIPWMINCSQTGGNQ